MKNKRFIVLRRWPLGIKLSSIRRPAIGLEKLGRCCSPLGYFQCLLRWQVCAALQGGGGGEMAATAGVITAVQYPGMADKIHKLLGFKFCKFSPQRQFSLRQGWGGGGEGVNVPEK